MRQLGIRSEMGLGCERLACDVRPDGIRRNRRNLTVPVAGACGCISRSGAALALVLCDRIRRILKALLSSIVLICVGPAGWESLVY